MSTTIPETETPRVIPVEVERAVKRGAELLDDRHPGWADKIDTETLNIRSGCDCVLAQLYGWAEGLVTLRFDPEDCYEHGFLVGGRQRADLDRAWLAEIMERRSA